MADKAITDLNTIPGSVDDNNTWFAVAQSGTAYKVSGHEFTLALGTILDGHGGVKSIVYTPPTPPSLTGTMVVTLADNTTTTVNVENGKGISSIAKTSTAGLVDTYTITYNDSTTSTFSVTNGAKGDTGDSWYVWIRYAGSMPTSDSDMGTTPDDWIGIYSGTEDDPSNLHYTDFDWFEYKGEKGDTGTASAITTQTIGYQSSNSGTVVPSGSWTTTIPTVPPGSFLWTRTQLAFNDGSVVTAYSVSRFGIDGTGAVSTVNSISPDGDGNVALTADDIPLTNNISVEDTIDQIETDMGDVSNLTTAASNCVGAINEVKTSTIKSLKGKRAYILGDSLNANGFGQHVLSISGMVGQSIGNGSTGFITVGTGNKRFSDLLSDLASSLSTAEKNSTDYFILMGGINDALNGVTASTEKPAVVSFISSAKTVFPNAEIIICPLHTFKWLTPTQYNCYSAIIDACRENGVRTTEDFLWWTIVDDYGINSGDDVHLTSSGYQILGGLIVNFIMGGDVLKTWTYGVESSIGTIFSNVLTRKGRHFYWRAVITQITTSDITRIAMATTSADSLKNMTWAFSTFLYGVLYYNSSYYPINSALERKSGGSGINLYTRVIAPNPPSSTVGGSVWFNGSWEVGIDEDPTK